GHDELGVARVPQLPRLHVPDPVRRVRSYSLPGDSPDQPATERPEEPGGSLHPVDFDLPAEAETYRGEVRAFVREHAREGRFPPDWTVRLAEAGYVAPHWPKPYGLDAGPIQQLVIDEELRAAGAPRPINPIGTGWGTAPVLGSRPPPEQAGYPPGSASWRERACQPFRAPGA